MAVVDYGSIVKGGLQSFNEVDKYLKAEEEKEYQIAKERRDNLYKADRDKMADFWKHYQQNYQEYRDNVQDDYNERKFAETIRVNDHNIDMANKKHALNVAQLEETKKKNEHNRKNDIFKNALALEKAENENEIKGVNSRTGLTGSAALNNFAKENKDIAKSIDTIIENPDDPEQKRRLVQELANSIPDERLRFLAMQYYGLKTGLQQESTITGMRNISNVLNTVGVEAFKDGNNPTKEQIVKNFVEYANENNQQDIQNVFGRVFEVAMSGTGKQVINGKEVIVGEFGGVLPNSVRFWYIEGTDKVGLVGDVIVNGNKMENVIANNINGDPIAYDESLLKSFNMHTMEAQINNIINNRPKLLSLKDYNKTYKIENPSESTKYEEYKTSNAIPINIYNKDPNIVTLKDAKAHDYEIDKAIEQSKNKPNTSVVSNLYTNRFNGVEKGDKVYIDDGKIVVPIDKEEEAERQAYKSIAKEVLSRKLNENDIAEVQQSKNLSREKAIEYLRNKYSEEEHAKYFKNNPELIKKRVKVDAISKGFQGDFSDNTFDLLTNKLKDDYVYIDENANKVISVAEFNKLPKEEQDKFEKTNISDKEDLDLMKAALSILPPHMALIFDSHGKEGKEKLDAALRPFVPDEEYRKTFINQYEEYKAERNSLRKSAGGNQGAYLRKFLETKKSVGDNSIPKEKIEEMYRITEHYKDLPLNDDDGKANKEKLLSELKDAGLNGTTMYRVIALLKTDEGKSVNSFREKKYSYTEAIKPEKKSQKLSDATSKQQNANNGLGGYGYTSTSLGGIVKDKKFDGPFNRAKKALEDMGLDDLNQ